MQMTEEEEAKEVNVKLKQFYTKNRRWNGEESPQKVLLEWMATHQTQCQKHLNSPICKSNLLQSWLKAANIGCVPLLQQFLSVGIDVNSKDLYGHSALSGACENNHDSAIELLLAHHADVNTCDQGGWTPLIAACCEGNEAVARKLVQLFANVNAVASESKVTACLGASKKGHESIVRLLLDYDVDVNACDEHGFTALMFECQAVHVDTAKLLLERGANPNVANKVAGRTPLMFACERSNVELAGLLLQHKADVNMTDHKGQTALMHVCNYVVPEMGMYARNYEEREAMARFLLEHGADLELEDDNRETALTIAKSGTLKAILNEYKQSDTFYVLK